MKLSEKFREERGLVLFPTMMLVILIFVIGLATLELTVMESRISFNQLEAARALSLAEAGVQMAVHQLEADPWWKEGYRNYLFGEGVIKEVKVDNKLYSVTIESLGEVNGIGRRIRVELARIPVPFAYSLVTNNLILGPGTKLLIEGDALHLGDFALTGLAELESFLLVDGSVTIDQAIVKGAIHATGEIAIHGAADIKAKLVSSREIKFKSNQSRDGEVYSDIPVLVPNISTAVDFNWYAQKPHQLLEEPVLSVDNLCSGILLASGDLTIMREGEQSYYQGQTVIVVPGTVRISCDLVPADPSAQSLFIVADQIFVDAHVRELWGALIAADSIQLMGGSPKKEIHGTLKAPSIMLSPGTIKLYYLSLPGNHLVKEPQFLYQINNWLEVIH
ncbi:MAG: hypothetical protein GX750_05245 [Clostridia bacterium]|nr:hypothetical protein [Clostridia bacterium]